MVVTCVTVFVKEENIIDFIDATAQNHKNSIKESGNLRFDILQSVEDPTRFFLYEAYESEESAGAHKKTKHYLTWRDTVADWMTKSREGISHNVIYPQEKELWCK